VAKDKLQIMTEGGQIFSLIVSEVKKSAEPGRRTKDLDDLAKRLCLKYRVRPSFLGYQGYPAAICVSIDDEVVHGIPGDRIFTKEDVVSLDFGVFHEGYHVDAAVTFTFDTENKKKMRLINTTREALDRAVDYVKPGSRVGDIGYLIQSYAEQKGYGVVRSLVGHGVGKELHQEPIIPNFGQKNTGMIIKRDMTLAIEPMITEGNYEVYQESDGWTYKTSDHSLASHHEYTIYIDEKEARILTDLPN